MQGGGRHGVAVVAAGEQQRGQLQEEEGVEAGVGLAGRGQELVRLLADDVQDGLGGVLLEHAGQVEQDRGDELHQPQAELLQTGGTCRQVAGVVAGGAVLQWGRGK